MCREGGVFEVDTDDAQVPWYKRLLKRIKCRRRLNLLFVATLFSLIVPLGLHATSWQTDIDNYDPNRWISETMVNATVINGNKPATDYCVMAEIDGELRGFAKEPMKLERDGMTTILYTVRVKGDPEDFTMTWLRMFNIATLVILPNLMRKFAYEQRHINSAKWHQNAVHADRKGLYEDLRNQ